ncbi:MAG: hypothetical protein ACMXYG_00240 [Candidatus Woesearchaeota archaeon]
MVDIKTLETNLYESFTRVKSDVLHLTDEMNKLSNAISKLSNSSLSGKVATLEIKIVALERMVRDMSTRQSSQSKKKTSTKKVKTAKKKADVKPKVVYRTKPKRKIFIASKNGKRYHEEDSLLIKKIKPKDRVVFKSKVAAENAGYTPSKVSFKA